MRERELMWMHQIDMNDDTEANKKKKKDAIRKTHKEKSQNHHFHCITKHVGRCSNRSLKMLHENDAHGKIIKLAKKSIEEEIINHNMKCFTMMVQSKVH